MAPRKATTADATAKEAKKAVVMKAVKRPERGFHRFRNGMLNVAPKGDEKRLVKENKKSPLLRLPPEIRNQIWGYALGGKTYRAIWDRPTNAYKFQTSLPRLQDEMGLLRVCRQIYVEAGLMPFTFNEFAFHDHGTMMYCLKVRKMMKNYQRQHITTVVFELPCRMRQRPFFSDYYKPSLLEFLPGVKIVYARLFPSAADDAIPVEAFKTLVRGQLEVLEGLAASIKIVVTDMGMNLRTYNELCTHPVVKSKPVAFDRELFLPAPGQN